ncbi:MAG: hypothetical protein HPY30_05725 [Gammaproteobacteria bacterium (ex Lamellibrachia satsuma)]|nr:MAG: hypothetical protein HPY30_05725 [Gammaproteobacteria bacterium (ex Lamellibrachia satsuma)]
MGEDISIASAGDWKNRLKVKGGRAIGEAESRRYCDGKLVGQIKHSGSGLHLFKLTKKPYNLSAAGGFRMKFRTFLSFILYPLSFIPNPDFTF